MTQSVAGLDKPFLKAVSLSPGSFARYAENRLVLRIAFEDKDGDLQGGRLELTLVDDLKEKKGISIPLTKSNYSRTTGKARIKTSVDISYSSKIQITARLVDASGRKGNRKKLVWLSNDQVDGQILDRIYRVENSLATEGSEEELNIHDRMEYFDVAGASVSVISRGRIEWSKGYGLLEKGGSRAVTVSTRFQAASLSKTITGAVMMLLVDDGSIELDQTANSYLTSWDIPDNEYTAGGQVTVRQLLNHTGGIIRHPYTGYAQGEQIPTLAQMLEGEAPANSPAVRVDRVPGSAGNYSNPGYLVLQQLFADVAGESFSSFASSSVFEPLGMKLSVFDHTLSPQNGLTIAHGHLADGEPMDGGWNRYPEHCPSGLWTTPTEFALYILELASAYNGEDSEVFSRDMMLEMFGDPAAAYGSGVVFGNENGHEYIMNDGWNVGYQCVFIYFLDLEFGAVIMTNHHNGYRLYNEIWTAIRRVYLE